MKYKVIDVFGTIWHRILNWLRIGLEKEYIMIFHVTLEEAEDGWIVAEYPALPGCVSQGKDNEAAIENIKEAITAWLWAEDQKAVAALLKRKGRKPLMVAV